ncbi:MAG TPA: hypothetical protein VN256_21045 [Pyrinomonadaceae bacterium]|nr:hypothetical protein [Pyrinomonadaceae bacterium]
MTRGAAGIVGQRIAITSTTLTALLRHAPSARARRRWREAVRPVVEFSLRKRGERLAERAEEEWGTGMAIYVS